jgi:VIT family protein
MARDDILTSGGTRTRLGPSVAGHRTHSHDAARDSLRDVILGGQDGLVNILGIILGVLAGGGGRTIRLPTGFAAAITESISMGSGWLHVDGRRSRLLHRAADGGRIRSCRRRGSRAPRNHRAVPEQGILGRTARSGRGNHHGQSSALARHHHGGTSPAARVEKGTWLAVRLSSCSPPSSPPAPAPPVRLPATPDRPRRRSSGSGWSPSVWGLRPPALRSAAWSRRAERESSRRRAQSDVRIERARRSALAGSSPASAVIQQVIGAGVRSDARAAVPASSEQRIDTVFVRPGDAGGRGEGALPRGNVARLQADRVHPLRVQLRHRGPPRWPRTADGEAAGVAPNSTRPAITATRSPARRTTSTSPSGSSRAP